MKIAPSLSAYLDFLRFGAALVVLLGHLGQDGFSLDWMPIGYLSHEAVIVFFVLSGFIIYSSTVGRGGSTEYAVARISRVYSVALPAIVFCTLLALAVERFLPESGSQIASLRPFSWADIAGSALFWNESWSSDTQLTLNGPYWSLCYEVWYYVVFGAFFFGRGPWRWPLVAAAAALAGPAIMVLFPIWCMGAWMAARPDRLPRLSVGIAWITLLGSVLLVVAISASEIDQTVKSYLHNRIPGFWRLEASQRVVTDHVIGLAVLAHIHAYRFLPAQVHRAFERARPGLVQLAGFSFTLYLFHRPMTEIAGALVPAEQQTAPVALLAVAAVLLACWLISFATERQLPVWRRTLNRALRRPGPGARLARGIADRAQP